MGTALNDQDMIVKEASLWEYAIAILTERITSLPKEAKDDLLELWTELTNASSKEECDEIRGAIQEILVPRLAGQVILKSPEKSGANTLAKRAEYLGKKIRDLRMKRDWTQEDLAKFAGLPQSHISRLESGKHSPSNATLQKIAKALGVKLSQIDYAE